MGLTESRKVPDIQGVRKSFPTLRKNQEKVTPKEPLPCSLKGEGRLTCLDPSPGPLDRCQLGALS